MIKVALIADEHTSTCLKFDFNVTEITPSNWRINFFIKNFDVLLIESCWRGKNNSWQRRVADYGRGQLDVGLAKLIKYCRVKSIPVVFWYKEAAKDCERFSGVADAADHIVCADGKLMPFFKALANKKDRVFYLPFPVQPMLHNQIGGLPDDNGRALFMGGLYLNEFPNRANSVIDCIRKLKEIGCGVDIVDRHFSTRKSDWPEDLVSQVGPPVAYKDTGEYFKRYLYVINVNSVADSGSMYSRRLIEALASGARVLVPLDNDLSFMDSYVDTISAPIEGYRQVVANSMQRQRLVAELSYKKLFGDFFKKIGILV